jgi:hypothetical protein
VTFTHLRNGDELRLARDARVVLTGSARDWLLREEWGYAGLGADPMTLVGTVARPGYDVQGVVGHAYGRWWALQAP